MDGGPLSLRASELLFFALKSLALAPIHRTSNPSVAKTFLLSLTHNFYQLR
jgi:hypothetical protein